MKPYRFHREADEEFTEALQHYFAISPALSGRFYDEIDRLIARRGHIPGATANSPHQPGVCSPRIFSMRWFISMSPITSGWSR